MKLMNWGKMKLLLLWILVGMSLTACGGGSNSNPGQGTLSTTLTDASTNAYQAVYVTISRVEVHSDSGGAWQTVANPNKTYNLLELVNGVRETLGITTLNAGHYTQMRLVLGGTPDPGVNIFSLPHPFANYVIDLNDAVHELTAPSGMTTGLKVVNGFDINPDQTTELILDFDAMHSVVIAGSSGKYQIKPTVKVLDVADGAIVSGLVSDLSAAPPGPLEGTLVTAQVVDPASSDAMSQVVIEGGTLSAANGGYALFLAAGNYNLVAVKDGYLSACSAVALVPPSLRTVDFTLELAPTAPGSVTGTASIGGASADQVVTIDFRQEATCEGASGPAMITIKSINVANGGSFEEALAAGNYQVVASTFGKTTQVVDNVVVTTAVVTDLGGLAF
jgi:hypothetical protein